MVGFLAKTMRLSCVPENVGDCVFYDMTLPPNNTLFYTNTCYTPLKTDLLEVVYIAAIMSIVSSAVLVCIR